MNYEQKYKAALNWIASLYDGLHGKTREEAEKFFPELCESKDERIRKALIEWMEEFPDKIWRGHYYKKDVLAWLEKLEVFAEHGDGLYYFGNNGFTYVGNANKNVVDFKAEDWYVSKVDGKIHNIYHSDKDESKFNVGDWIVNNISKDIFLIKSINNGYCTLEDINGNIIYPCLPPCENETHLWTINDAKDGDVIVSGDEAYLFNSLSDGRIKLHCWFNKSTNHFWLSADVKLRQDAIFYPASKEERDIFFARMKEEGYWWDSKNKELKEGGLL